jgi:hypothetical protein
LYTNSLSVNSIDGCPKKVFRGLAPKKVFGEKKTKKNMNKKTARWWDIPAILLLLAALEASAFRLRVTGWTANLAIIETLAFLSCLLGLALGYSSFRAWTVRIFGLAYTVFFIPFEMGLFLDAAPEWSDKLNNLYARLYYSIFDFFHNKPVQDPLLFLTVMALFFWLIGILAGYQMTRHGKPWGALVVSGLGMLIIDFYTPYTANRNEYSAVFVFLALFLIARIYFMRSRREWAEKGATVDPEIGFDLGRTVAVSGLVLVLAAWNVPILVEALTPGTDFQRSLAQQWETWRDKLQNAVAGLTSPVVATSDFFGNSMALGAGGTRDEEVVFTMQVNGIRPKDVRFYWKARSYDTYNGSWSGSINTSTTVGRSEWPFLYPNWAGRKIVDLTFMASANGIRNFYVPSFPLTIDHGADVIGSVTRNGTLDLVGVLADPSLKRGETIRVRAWVTSPSVNQLQSALDKPGADMSTYLQLPPGFSLRIQNLARLITANLRTNYEKTKAITTWLRNNITYQETVTTPPEGIDPIEWFLFETKKGFCNYYASAEVLMLRSLGIPARLAVGYAEGELEETTDIYTIKRRDSHAWPEVYFEGFGWVEFEPTASQPAIELPVEIIDDSAKEGFPTPATPREATPFTPGHEETDFTNTGTSSGRNIGTVLIIAIPIVGVSVIFILFWLQRRGKIKILKHPIPVMIENNLEKRGWQVPDWITQWARLAELSPIERMYARMSWTLPLLGQTTDHSHTPSERLQQIMKVLPEAGDQIAIFLREYQQAEYSPYPFDLEKARQADRLVWRIAIRTFFRKLTGSGQPTGGA